MMIISSPSSSTPSRQLIPSESMPPPALPFRRFKQQDIRKLDKLVQMWTEESFKRQTNFFMYEGAPMVWCDSPLLINWLVVYHQGTGEIASRKQLAVRAHVRAEEVKGRVIARLRTCKGVTVGVDGWTNVRHDKVINLCPVGRAVAYYWDSVVLKRGATAEEQAGPIWGRPSLYYQVIDIGGGNCHGQRSCQWRHLQAPTR